MLAPKYEFLKIDFNRKNKIQILQQKSIKIIQKKISKASKSHTITT